MRLVLDTNVLVAALIKDSFTRSVLFLPELEFLLPEHALEEVRRHRVKILRHSRLQPLDLDLLLNLLLESITIVPQDRITPHIKAAEALIGAIDLDDVPFVALALAEENHGIWSNDQAFDQLPGIKCWTTADIKRYLLQRST